MKVWATRSVAHTFVNSKPESFIRESLLNKARTYFSKNLSLNLISRAERFVV
jgi:hypothetical protein